MRLSDRFAAKEKLGLIEAMSRHPILWRACVASLALLTGWSALSAQNEYGPNRPRVVNMFAVAPDLLAVEIQEGDVELNEIVPYFPEERDEIVELENNEGLFFGWRVDRGGEPLGYLSGDDRKRILLFDRYDGQPLDVEAARRVESYGIQSIDDRTYSEMRPPKMVSHKAKPNRFARAPGMLGVLHTVYLRLHGPMEEGALYALDLGGLNTLVARHEYRYEPLRQRSDAVQVNQAGFAPSDPVKRAYVSVWMGEPGGGLEYAEPLRFHVVDAIRGEIAYSGESELHWPADKPEKMYREANHVLADVHRLDFSELSDPSRYYVYVEGIGRSYPFDIREDTWRHVVRTSLRGFYHHRSGIELGPPYTDFWRPRPHHPEDGYRIVQSGAPLMGTSMGFDYSGPSSFAELRRLQTFEELPEAWGGHMDAGDWDRRAQHLIIPRMLFEMYEISPGFYAGLDLNIPESDNNIPDILDEALWTLDFFLRMQKEDGGVSGGVESAAHPAPGDVSWREMIPVFAYAPDPWTSYEFAAAAARAGRIMQDFDHARAKAYREAALRAMDWANEQTEKLKQAGPIPGAMVDIRNLAALELYQLTGDAKWHELFAVDTVLRNAEQTLNTPAQREALFSYVRLPAGRGQFEWKELACQALVLDAERALQFSRENAYSLVARDREREPFIGIYTGPVDGQYLVRGHFLTGRPDFMEALFASTQFGLGANPDNLVFTTGLGINQIRWVLHEDAFKTARPVPPGITVYGPADHSADVVQGGWWLSFVDGFRINEGRMYPHFKDWPVLESYLDMWNFVSQNEYTPWQNFAPVSYSWGYMADWTEGQ